MIKTPIRYYGGKQKILKHILPFLPDHKVYCEPFFGGGAVFFAKRPVRNEVINDRNPFVMNFYRIAQERFLDLQAKISSTLHSRHVYEQAVHMYNFPDFYGELEKAWAFWVVCHMSIHIKFCAIHLSNTPHSISGSPLFYFHFLLLAYHL